MRVASLIVIASATLALAGCSGGPATPSPTSTIPVIAPGRPGETARTLSPTEAATAVPSPTANAADVIFMQDMIVHHRQALDMSTGAATRAASDQVKRLAARISAVQGPEINAMIRWLRQEGQRIPDHHAEHKGMPGMATPEQLAELRAARGADFDRLYLRLMIAHHMGAITMAAGELEKGSHVIVQELAEDISVSQAAEVNRMRGIQVSSGG
uniref:Putative lipoprotein n=1 Tax=Sphaerisporangium sp. SANK 60911 TaxID=1354075 RepID=V5YT84_9ACTN|nr:putative lipoprotein [Sphaerisporangium sp. SANK 60911]